MNQSQKEELVRLAGGSLQFDCPMAQYTTFRVGGKAEAIYEPHDLQGLRRVIAYLNEESIAYLVVGRGSNLLVKDEGIEGIVVFLRGSLAAIEHEGTDHLAINAGAGLAIIDLMVYCRASGLGDLEFLAGIPGTVGGALAMNAGAFGQEIGTKVREVQVITPLGKLLVMDRAQLRFSYRNLEIEKGSVIIRGIFESVRKNGEIVGERIVNYLRMRKENQPLEYPNAGSIFKNPPNDYAGRLIEEVDLKGKKIGDAMISEKHANFIINTGSAKTKDILALMDLAREKVRREMGIELQPEIKVVGR
ncbi:MAG TPA: UDP-N-acetylenolpyruvoylglucosamine reductase [Desulfobacteraceae bacterium]|nr:UDP-N-acetylenolpyruvoylglucosamine reductase [Desulfobacteraceae bacterium]